MARNLLQALIVVLALSYATIAYGHIVLSSPTPRSTNSGIKSPYPCGPNGFGTGVRTAMKPGVNIIEWDETINHNGAPYRIALSIGNDNGYDNVILVQHLKHNDAGTTTKRHKYKLVLPDIDCAQCALQMINVMTDKESAACDYPTLKSAGSKCSSVYHTCADISINGTVAAASYYHTNPTYTAYDLGESTTWTQDSNSKWYLASNWNSEGNTTGGTTGLASTGQSGEASTGLDDGSSASMIIPSVIATCIAMMAAMFAPSA